MCCLWSGVINFHSFPNGSFISLELHLLWTHRVFPVISWFLIILTCCFLGTSHFGRPPVFWKQFILDTALDISSNIFHFFKILVFQVFRKGVGEVMGGGGGGNCKRQKMTHNYQFQSVTLYLRNCRSYHQDFWYSSK